MRPALVCSALLAPLCALAAPHPISNAAVAERANPVKPKPCVALVPAPDANQTQARFNDFANAFIVTKNITHAFEYIAQNYINHNPYAQNGFDSAWNILSPIWGGENITPEGTYFNGTQGWLHYMVQGLGDVVDRYRWDGGCIVEHWDQGEKFPTNTSTPTGTK